MDNKGKNNPNYKSGKYCTEHRCKDCNKLIDKNGRSLRCKECAGLYHNISKSNIEKAVKKSNCYLQVGEILGVSRVTAKNKIKEFDIDISHFKPGRGRLISNDDLFSIGSVKRYGTLRKRILNDSLIDYICSECSMEPIWNNKDLVLELDHINGNNTDNRLKNLRFLCPNCHAQQSTNKGRNAGRRGGQS